MKMSESGIRHQHGLTLIELMVALTISLLLLTGTASLFISNKRIYREQEEMGRLQENARFAVEVLIRDLRMAGYVGCSDNMGAVENDIDGADDDDATVSFINGIEGSEAAAGWKPSDALIGVGAVAGTDAITVRFLQPTALNLGADMGTTSAALTVNSTTGLAAGDLFAVSDCDSSDIMEATEVTSSGGVETIKHVTGVSTAGSPGNADAVLSKLYGTNAELMRFVARRYFIGNGANGPGLMMAEGYGTAEELIEGVESMQILYGEDTTADQIIDSFVTAAAVTNWANVMCVRIALLLRTIEEGQHNDIDTKTYNLLGTTVNPVDDRRRRKVFSSTIQIRNRT